MHTAIRIYLPVLRRPKGVGLAAASSSPDTVKDLSGPDKLYSTTAKVFKRVMYLCLRGAQLLGLQFRDPSLSRVSLS